LESKSPGSVKGHVPLWKRQTAHWSRWLHTYLSMASFAILLFFAVTGITLNHQSAFTGMSQPRRFTGLLDATWMKEPEGHKGEIVAAFRSRHGIRAALSDFHLDDGRAWSLVIDISAILMVLVSLSGLVLIFFLHKKLRSGLIALAIGTALCYVVYQVWVS
jgi:hypothetical protein